MATTTYEAHRDAQISLVEALTPTTLASVRFRHNRREVDFFDWAEENKAAAFRQFVIRDRFDYDVPEVINNQRWLSGVQEVVVVYPNDYRYGGATQRDQMDVIREDKHLIDKEIGDAGYGNLTDAVNQLLSFTVQEADAVTYLILEYRFGFWRTE